MDPMKGCIHLSYKNHSNSVVRAMVLLPLLLCPSDGRDYGGSLMVEDEQGPKDLYAILMFVGVLAVI